MHKIIMHEIIGRIWIRMLDEIPERNLGESLGENLWRNFMDFLKEMFQENPGWINATVLEGTRGGISNAIHWMELFI